MNLKYKFGVVLLILYLLPLPSAAHENLSSYDDIEGWIEIYPQRFDTIEQFFLQQGCSFYQSAAHIYNIDNEHWLTHEEAREIYPEISDDIVNLPCEITASKQQLATLLNTGDLESNGKVLLYFDVIRDESGDHRNILPTSMLNSYYNKLERLSDFTDIPKYRIITSRVGFKPAN